MRPVTLEELLEEKNNPDMIVHTKDLYKYQFFHGTYTLSQDTLYGKGIKIIERKERSFAGAIALKDISVLNVEKENADKNAQGQIMVQTNDFNSYQFEEGDYSFTADSIMGSGKSLRINKEIPFEGKIPLNDIYIFDVNQLNTGNTILLVLGVGLIGLIVAAAIAVNDLNNSMSSGCNKMSYR
jgi:hypothetical protein